MATDVHIEQGQPRFKRLDHLPVIVKIDPTIIERVLEKMAPPQQQQKETNAPA